MAKVSVKRFITDDTGAKVAVILDIEEYRELLEDMEDLRLIAELKDEPSVPFEQVKKRLKDNGLI